MFSPNDYLRLDYFQKNQLFEKLIIDLIVIEAHHGIFKIP